MDDNQTYNALEKVIEFNEQKQKDLRCCANCNDYNNVGCFYKPKNMNSLSYRDPQAVCYKWKWDELTYEERIRG